MITSKPNDFPLLCLDPEVCHEPFLNPGYLSVMHQNFIRCSNKKLAHFDSVFDSNDSEYAHFYGTILRYFTRHPEFFDSKCFLDNHPKKSFNKGLLILGGNGVGKTFMFKVLADLNLTLRQFGNSFSFISSHEVVEIFNMHGTKGVQHFTKGQRYFDDVGSEETGTHFGKIEVFRNLIERRHSLFVNSGKKTFMSSNLSRKELTEIYGSRVESRLYEMFNIIHAGGSDRRKI